MLCFDVVELRSVSDDDLPVFFAQQLDPEARSMAAFTVADPADRVAFDAKWARILADPGVTTRTIVADGAVAGSVSPYRDSEPDARAGSYCLGRSVGGRGLARQALAAPLRRTRRPRDCPRPPAPHPACAHRPTSGEGAADRFAQGFVEEALAGAGLEQA